MKKRVVSSLISLALMAAMLPTVSYATHTPREDFYPKLAQLIQADRDGTPVHSAGAAADDPLQNARLIVLADKLNPQGLGARAVLSDGTGMWVLQFDTPSQAKTAAGKLAAKGISAEPDHNIPPVERVVHTSAAAQVGAHYTWGAEDCAFDRFASQNAGQFSGNSVVVAVVDSGVDSGHPLLKGRVLAGCDLIDGDSDPMDEHFHGTHVAGTVIDCVGAAPVSILPVRVLDEDGEGTSVTVAAGIKYAADHGADIINLSLGGGCGQVEDAAISYAISKGCLVVAAAGNERTDTQYSCPAHIQTPGMVVVSAGDQAHASAPFSNFGKSVDLMAPGVEIKSSVPGGSWGICSGTSMAAPHAAAAAALIDLAGQKTLSPAALESKLRSATAYGAWTNEQEGCGFLDLSKLLSQPDPDREIIPQITLSADRLSLTAGETRTLTADTDPKGLAVVWTTDNTDVALATNRGEVIAQKTGTANITAWITFQGKSYQAVCTVTVSPASGETEIGEWTTVRIPERPGYRVESKTQYRWQCKEWANSTLSSLPGWTLTGSTGTSYSFERWTDWCQWGDIPIVEADYTRQETRTVYRYVPA